MMRKRELQVVLVLFFCLLFFSSIYNFAQQAPPPAKAEKTQVEKAPEKIIPSPKNIKESTTIYVFLSWIWVSIFILIYVLRLKIREVDRLYVLKFFKTGKDTFSS